MKRMLITFGCLLYCLFPASAYALNGSMLGIYVGAPIAVLAYLLTLAIVIGYKRKVDISWQADRFFYFMSSMLFVLWLAVCFALTELMLSISFESKGLSAMYTAELWMASLGPWVLPIGYFYYGNQKVKKSRIRKQRHRYSGQQYSSQSIRD